MGSTFGAGYSAFHRCDGLNISECHDSCREEEGSGSPYPRNACECSNNVFYAERGLGIDCNLSWILYYYHPDYLGHNEYITDITGRPYRYFHFSAFGESLIEKNTNYGQFSSPYRFNGKELDPETGNYYYGARYYNPVWSMWLGVDPLAGDFPHLTPYNFVENNPIKLVDPDGRSAHGWEECGDGTFVQISKEGGDNVDYIYNRNAEGNLALKETKTVTHTEGSNFMPLDYFDEGFSSSYRSWRSDDGHQGYMKPGVRYSVNQAIVPDYTIEKIILGGILVKGVFGLARGMFAAKEAPKLLNQFNSAESLIQGAGNLTKVKGGMQGFVKGDGAAIFKAISQGGTRQANGSILMKDGTTLFNHFSTKTGVYTIDINKASQIYKIRVTP